MADSVYKVIELVAAAFSQDSELVPTNSITLYTLSAIFSPLCSLGL